MRTFIAIELPSKIKESLANVQNKLKATGADVKWVEPQNIHLTLKFLGEIDDKKLSRIAEIMNEIVENNNPFDIRISSIGAFPKIDFPRVIWVGVEKGNKETKEIAKALEDKICEVGIPKEDRTFSSHITIGRTRSTLNRIKLVQELKNLAIGFEKDNLDFSVTKITLFKSTLTPKGPLYEALKETNLKTI